MQSKIEIIKSIKIFKKPEDSELRCLPFKGAFVYGRISSPAQLRDSKESIREIATLVRLAKEDGYRTQLNPVQVEAWLKSISAGTSEKGVMEEGQVIIDVRDLELSGQLDADERKGMENLQEHISTGKAGAVYITEGVSRLSRDRDHILPYVLLKQLKKYQVRVRTPEGVWNPAIERDWEYLADEFEMAIDELKIMNKRLLRRKAQKAARGEFVGEPVPPGFIVPVLARKPNGLYEYGKLQPYPPHAAIDEQVLRVYVSNGGSQIKTMKSISSIVYPFFPSQLSYMERLSSLRKCKRLANGYEISPNLMINLATNLKLIGVWKWGHGEIIPDNHPPAVPEDLFLEARDLAIRPGKAKGRAANSEPLEWWGLLYCCNHPEPRRMTCHHVAGNYRCDKDYQYGKGPGCLYKRSHLLDKPLTRAVLEQLELDPCVEEIISRLELDAGGNKLSQIRERQRISSLEKEVEKWKALLPCCVNEATGQVDREKEQYYWDRIHETNAKLEELKNRPATKSDDAVPDYTGLRDFLKSLPANWDNFSGSLRNRFLRSLISRVELKGDDVLEATINWKAGFQQKVLIQPVRSRRLKEKLWTKDEDNLLVNLFPSSKQETIVTRLPNRSWKSITLRAGRLKIRRKRGLGRSSQQPAAPALGNGLTSNSSEGIQSLKVLQQLPSGSL